MANSSRRLSSPVKRSAAPLSTRFYATHVFLFPALMFLLIGLHLYLVIVEGVSEPPRVGQVVDPATYKERYHQVLEHGIPFFPDAAWKDVVFALAVGLVVVALAAIVGPPSLGALPDPTNVMAYPRPDWYFLWYFSLLALIPNNVEDAFIIGFPLLIAVGLFILPLLAYKGERSPLRRPWAPIIVGLAALSIAVLIREGQIAPWSPNVSVGPVPASVTESLSSLGTPWRAPLPAVRLPFLPHGRRHRRPARSGSDRRRLATYSRPTHHPRSGRRLQHASLRKHDHTRRARRSGGLLAKPQVTHGQDVRWLPTSFRSKT